MLAAGAVPIARGGKKPVMTARRRVWMIVPVTLSLVVTPARVAVVVIPMIVRTHDLMLIGAVFVRAVLLVRAILGAHQRRAESRHRESRREQYRFPKVLAHIVFLVQG